MKKILLLISLIILPVAKIYAQDINVPNPLESLDERINSFMTPATEIIHSIVFFEISIGSFKIPFVLLWLILASVYFTIYMRFINITGFIHAINLIKGNYDNPNDKGEVTHLQALTAALSGTLGLGNIAGVAVAISMGGPGATLWMIVAGLLGMTLKFVECTLGVKYRNISFSGEVSGGGMYYLREGLHRKGWSKLGKFLSVFFAISCIGGAIGGGNMIQVNQATQQIVLVTGGTTGFLGNNAWIFGLIMAIIVGLVLLGGIKSIVKVTDKLVPFMVGIYSLVSLYIIFLNYKDIPETFEKIITGAFEPNALYGGVLGVLIIGFKRAAFSNEAGIGSATMAHAAAKTNEPISEGIVALIEPFFDTVIVCTLTAFVIIITNSYESGITEGVQLTSKAFGSVVDWFPFVLSIAVILFALATMISWSYYGLKAWTFLFGESKKSKTLFNVMYCFFVVIGSSMQLNTVFDFGDTMIFAMCFPNIIGLYILAPEIKRDLKDYFLKLETGQIKKFK